MPHLITCHVCSQPLSVPDDAPPKVIGPRCLSSVANPLRERAAPDPTQPLSVIPVEDQTHWDSRLSAGGVVLLTLAVMAGVLLAFWLTDTRQHDPGMLLIFVVAITIVAITLVATHREPEQPVAEPIGGARKEHIEASPTTRILDYRGSEPRSIRPDRKTVSLQRELGMMCVGVICGFLAIPSCLAARLPIGLFGIPAAGLVFLAVPRMRSLGAGMLISIALAILILASICGGMFKGL